MKLICRSVLLIITFLSNYTLLLSSEYNWNKKPYPGNITDSSTLCSIHAFDAYKAVAVGSNGIIINVDIINDIYSKKHYGDDSLNQVYFADNVHGWVVGNNGTVYATEDKGNTWTLQAVDVNNHLNSVTASDQNNAWIAGDSGLILHTTDGGKNWVKQEYEIPDSFGSSIAADTCVDFISIAFKDSAAGCIGGNWRISNEPVILVTCDSGTNWIALNISKNAPGLYKVAYRKETPIAFLLNCNRMHEIQILENDKLSCCEKFSVLCHSYNVFDAEVISNIEIYAIDSLHSQIAWIAGTNASILRTINKGENWLFIGDNKNRVADNLQKVYFKDSLHGFIGGENGTFLVSNDGGNTWDSKFDPINASLSFSDIVFYDSLHGYLTKQNKSESTSSMMITIDGGQNWKAVDNSPDGIKRFHIADKYNIFSLDDYKSLHLSKKQDGKWIYESFGTGNFIYDVFSISSDTFFIVGNRNEYDGAIFKSTDRGTTFDILSSVDHADAKGKSFFSITFSDHATGWVAGDSGIVLKSTDSGYTWHRQPSPTNERITKIRFYNKFFGWIFSLSNIFLTSDGGNTWQDKSILTSTKIADAFCSDPQNCWAVGDNGLILHLSNKPDKYIDIIYPDEKTVLSVGDSLKINWNSEGILKVSVEMSYDNGQNYTVYCTETDNDGEEVITISANAVASTKCKIRIRNLEKTVQDESELFAIENSSKALKNKVNLPAKYSYGFTNKSILIQLNDKSSAAVSIYSISGRKLFSKTVSGKRKYYSTQKIPTELLKRGCYLVQIIIGKRVFTEKLLVNR